MKGLIVINGYPAEKFLRQADRIATELRAMGVETDIRQNGEVTAVMEPNGGVSSVDGYSFAVYLDKDKYLGRLLESSGLRLFNTPRAVEICDDKMTTYLALRESGLRLVKTVAAPLCYTKGASPRTDFLKKVADALGFPLVAKTSYGSFGAGVQLVHGMAELLETEKNMLRLPHFYQAYVEESKGKDIRVLVIGGKAFAAMRRVAQDGEFRSNVELGGVGEPVALSADYREAAERAASVLGLDYCGVDLLETAEGPVVCEVNSNAFFEGMEAVTGKNVARAYAEYIVRECK